MSRRPSGGMNRSRPDSPASSSYGLMRFYRAKPCGGMCTERTAHVADAASGAFPVPVFRAAGFRAFPVSVLRAAGFSLRGISPFDVSRRAVDSAYENAKCTRASSSESDTVMPLVTDAWDFTVLSASLVWTARRHRRPATGTEGVVRPVVLQPDRKGGNQSQNGRNADGGRHRADPVESRKSKRKTPVFAKETDSLGRGAIGSTSDSGSEGSRFESWRPRSIDTARRISATRTRGSLQPCPRQQVSSAGPPHARPPGTRAMTIQDLLLPCTARSRIRFRAHASRGRCLSLGMPSGSDRASRLLTIRDRREFVRSAPGGTDGCRRYRSLSKCRPGRPRWLRQDVAGRGPHVQGRGHQSARQRC